MNNESINTLFQELNDTQRAAVSYNDGPHLVIAGAGSGKTRVLTYKVSYLLATGVPAGHILALTFTNKAAREMKQRIAKLVGDQMARYLWMGTFHSICARILRAQAHSLGYSDAFTIYDTTDSRSTVKQIIKDMQLDDKVYKVNDIAARISEAKSNLITASIYSRNAVYAKQDRIARHYQMADIYLEYERRLKTADAMDFDDLLMNVVFLLRDHPDVREQFQQQFWHILVDEYQDTNPVQAEIVRYLAAPQNHICVVGDDAQSIYSFRGATIENILNFQREYANARLFKLERNYRSTQTIVNAANSLIDKNREQIRKAVYSEKEVGSKLTLTHFLSDRDESVAVTKEINAAHKQHRDYEDIAVLYRTNAQSRGLELELRKLGIPYRIYGGTSFYQRKEVKDAVAYLRLIVNPRDDESFRRVINTPAHGIGATTIARLSDAARNADVSLMQVAANPADYSTQISAGTTKKVQAFAALISRFENELASKNAFELATDVINASGLMMDAMTDSTPEGQDRKQNLDELLSGIHQFVDEQENDFVPITAFLTEISLLTDQDEHTDDTTHRVTLMTVHAAKGLEFPIIYIVGLEEDLFPSAFCSSERDIEEERRLLYVAITRAEERCHLSYTSQRWRNGQLSFSNPSRFLKDIDPKYVTRLEGKSEVTQAQNFGFFLSATPFSRPSAEPASFSRPTTEPKPQQSKLSATHRQVSAVSAPPGSAAWKAGDRLHHRVFGNGTVIRVYSENGNDKIEIKFDTQGVRTLLLAYAKLDKI